MKSTGSITLAAFVFGAMVTCAQETVSESKPENKPQAKVESHNEPNYGGHVDTRNYKTFYLRNVSAISEANELLTAIRLMVDPQVKLYLDPMQKAITVRGNDLDFALTQHILDDLDRPKKQYLITYTVSDVDAGKRVGIQHYALTAASGQRATLKQGSKVPIVTGSYNPGTKDAQQQMTYLDVGLNFDATPEDIANGVSLRSKVEQSTVAPEISGVGASDPIIRQSVLENVTSVPLGKPTTIGSVDVPGSTRHLDVQVQVDLVK